MATIPVAVVGADRAVRPILMLVDNPLPVPNVALSIVMSRVKVFVPVNVKLCVVSTSTLTVVVPVTCMVLPVDVMDVTPPLPPVPVMVNVGYVPVTLTVPAPVSDTVWSGAVLVIVYVPDVVIGDVPPIETPVPATTPTDVTVPLPLVLIRVSALNAVVSI